MAVARMVGRLVSNDDTRAILKQIKSAPKVKTPTLDDLSLEAVKEVERSRLKIPNEQGRLLAEWLRGKPQIIAQDGLVYPEEILKKWKVKLTKIDLRSQNIDALCTWGPKHGPTVLINRNGHLSHYPTGRRSSLAHEICHLLVDRDGSPPVAQVFGGEVPRVLEQRANAFGAEVPFNAKCCFDGIFEAKRHRTDARGNCEKLQSEFRSRCCMAVAQFSHRTFSESAPAIT
jgi:hypothetical protein